MPVVYADDVTAPSVPGLDGRHARMTAEELSGVGFFRAIVTALGLRDPITHYEGAMPLPEVFAKYDRDLDLAEAKTKLLRSRRIRDNLLAQLAPLKKIRDTVRGAFLPGAVWGGRDRERLARLVQGLRDYRKDLRTAVRQYGLVGPEPRKPPPPFVPPPGPIFPPPAPPVAPPAPPEPAVLPLVPIAAGVALLALLGAFGGRK